MDKWTNGKIDELSLESLGKAQQDYFNKLAETIPGDTSSILDVGSGTGSNAFGLIQKAYSVDCVCPSSKLNMIARQKLPADSRIFECSFEELETGNTYDLLMFAESFHYLDAKQAFSQISKYTKKHVLIFDYFPWENASDNKKISHRQFVQLMSDSFPGKFDILIDQDVTDCISPTFMILDDVKNNYINPFGIQLVDDLRKKYPISSFFLYPLLRRVLSTFKKTSKRYETFPKRYEYRLILLRVKSA